MNYWPVFSIACDLVQEFPVRSVPPIMDRIADAVSDLVRLGATTYHDLTGRMFQTLISDRKFLATYYTLAESACLLAELSVARLNVDWSDKKAIEKLRNSRLRVWNRCTVIRITTNDLSSLSKNRR